MADIDNDADVIRIALMVLDAHVNPDTDAGVLSQKRAANGNAAFLARALLQRMGRPYTKDDARNALSFGIPTYVGVSLEEYLDRLGVPDRVPGGVLGTRFIIGGFALYLGPGVRPFFPPEAPVREAPVLGFVKSRVDPYGGATEAAPDTTLELELATGDYVKVPTLDCLPISAPGAAAAEANAWVEARRGNAELERHPWFAILRSALLDPQRRWWRS